MTERAKKGFSMDDLLGVVCFAKKAGVQQEVMTLAIAEALQGKHGSQGLGSTAKAPTEGGKWLGKNINDVTVQAIKLRREIESGDPNNSAVNCKIPTFAPPDGVSE